MHVNTAWLMEAFGVAGRINVSETVAGHAHGQFELEPRGPIKAKHDARTTARCAPAGQVA